jgi:FkbM family methyltransferase
VNNTVALALKSLFRAFGFDVVTYKVPVEGHELLNVMSSLSNLRAILDRDPDDEGLRFVEYCAKQWRGSKAQIFQDLFVQNELGEKTGGYFVEFGATDGIHLSNTHSLEKDYQWGGVLSEPARCWHDALKSNRGCNLDLRCVWDRTGQTLEFSEVDAAELSTITEFAGRKGEIHAETRKHARRYEVTTVSLNDLLEEVKAPAEIDYLSIDTEGSELKILSAFDFNKFSVHIITVEHNFMPERERIYDLLTKNGFRRKFEMFSRWDDWYVRS